MYNCNKFKQFMHDRNLGKKDFAEQLSVNPARIDELCRGKEIKPLLDRICNLFKVDMSIFYGDYVEPDFMKEIRAKIKIAENRGDNYNEIAKMAGVNHNVIRDIVNHPGFSCSDNIAKKILFANFNIDAEII